MWIEISRSVYLRIVYFKTILKREIRTWFWLLILKSCFGRRLSCSCKLLWQRQNMSEEFLSFLCQTTSNNHHSFFLPIHKNMIQLRPHKSLLKQKAFYFWKSLLWIILIGQSKIFRHKLHLLRQGSFIDCSFQHKVRPQVTWFLVPEKMCTSKTAHHEVA